MADNKNPGDLEGEPYATIEFVMVKCGTVQKRMKIDCDLAGPQICGLMEDFAEMFEVPADKQKWYFQNKLLNDEQTLWKSGIKEETEIRVVAS